jgi:hypothetical protein
MLSLPLILLTQLTAGRWGLRDLSFSHLRVTFQVPSRFLNCFIIHMCIQGLGHFCPPAPPPPPRPPPPPPPPRPPPPRPRPPRGRNGPNIVCTYEYNKKRNVGLSCFAVSLPHREKLLSCGILALGLAFVGGKILFQS